MDTTGERSSSGNTYVGLILKGFAMGFGVIPGVSGGTMAFILGIFEELIDSIRRVASPAFIRAVLTLRWKSAIEIGNVKFLTAVGGGAFVSILTLARVLEWLMKQQPVLVWSFFFGLVLASVIAIATRIRTWNGGAIASLVAGTVGAYVIVGLVRVETPDNWWFIAFAGAVAATAMILPGVSGAFVLVLLGKYQMVLEALNRGQLEVLVILCAGSVIGLVTMAQVLGWFFRHYHDLTVAALTGFMLGSLRKVWPWQETVSTYVNRHGVEVPAEVMNVMPSMGAEVGWALLLAALGLVAAFFMRAPADPAP